MGDFKFFYGQDFDVAQYEDSMNEGEEEEDHDEEDVAWEDDEEGDDEDEEEEKEEVSYFVNNDCSWLKTFHIQRGKKVVSNSLGPVDFAIGLVNSVLNLRDGQMICFGEF